MVVEDSGVWVSVGDAPIVHLYHAPSATLMTTVDCTRAVVDLLRGKGGYRRANCAFYKTNEFTAGRK